MINQLNTVTIVIPSYNRAHTIARTLDSFIAQTYANWKVFVVDDFSTDNTKDVVLEYVKKDSRISYMINERKKGAPGARNTGLLHANTDWVCFFDSDDYAYSYFLKKMMPLAIDDCDVVTCDAYMVHLDGRPTKRANFGGEGNVEYDIMTENIYIGNVTIIRKNKLIEIGLLDEDCQAYQELDTHLRLSSICNYKLINEPLFEWYCGDKDTITIKKKLNHNAKCYVIWHNRKRFRTVAYESLKKQFRNLFVHASLPYKVLLIKALPEGLLLIPALYLNVIIRKLNLYFNLNIHQL